jgi:hypothetical protein
MAAKAVALSASDILCEELENLLRDIVERHERAGQVASGHTRASFEVVVSGLHGAIMGYKWPAPVLETGRKEGKVPYNFQDIIKEWIEAKGLKFKDEKQLNRWASAIAWKIRREGTKLYSSRGHKDIFETAIADFRARLAERIALLFKEEVVNNIFNRLI